MHTIMKTEMQREHAIIPPKRRTPPKHIRQHSTTNPCKYRYCAGNILWRKYQKRHRDAKQTVNRYTYVCPKRFARTWSRYQYPRVIFIMRNSIGHIMTDKRNHKRDNRIRLCYGERCANNGMPKQNHETILPLPFFQRKRNRGKRQRNAQKKSHTLRLKTTIKRRDTAALYPTKRWSLRR